MKNKLGEQTIVFNNKPRIIGNYSIVGEKEGNGPFKEYFHYILLYILCQGKVYLFQK